MRRVADASGFVSLADNIRGTMFDQAVAPVSCAGARPTSRRAARLATPRAPSVAIRGLAEVAATVTGLTPDEAADLASRPGDPIEHGTMRARFCLMRQKGWLEGTEMERESGHRGMMEVLRITDAGRAELDRRWPEWRERGKAAA